MTQTTPNIDTQDKILYTVLGEPVKESWLEDLELIECPFCHFAVLEDEFFPCPNCDHNVCLYCWIDGFCCDNKGDVNGNLVQ